MCVGGGGVWWGGGESVVQWGACLQLIFLCPRDICHRGSRLEKQRAVSVSLRHVGNTPY